MSFIATNYSRLRWRLAYEKLKMHLRQRRLSKEANICKPILPNTAGRTQQKQLKLESVKQQDKDLVGERSGRTVLVTGGAGFLGQHIISLLQTRAPWVDKIKVLDIKPYRNRLGNKERVRVESITCCITDLAKLKTAFTGVHSVYHVAGKISYGTFPDIEGMRRINVLGTQNVIQACLETGVEHLVFCSTVDVVIGYKDIIGGDEVTTKPPSTFLFPGYPEFKYTAECMVLDAHGKTSKTGSSLHTISLRANVMYGEGDPYYVTEGLKKAHDHGGILYQVGNGKNKFQQAYVGNTAWSFICADKALEQNPQLGGKFYFVPDNTPVQNSFQFLQPFLTTRGYQLSQMKIPFGLVYGFLLFAEIVARILAPVFKISLPTESYSIKYINMNLFFNGNKAKKELGFKPLFSPDLALSQSLNYYKHVSLNN